MGNQGRNNLVKYPIQDNVRLEVYWRDDRAGRGPAASLYVHDDEILRLDCFGTNQGHCHMNLRQNKARRWCYPEGTVKEHIGRSAFELRMNHPFCLHTNQDSRVQAIKIEPEKLEAVADQMTDKMLDFADKLGLLT